VDSQTALMTLLAGGKPQLIPGGRGAVEARATVEADACRFELTYRVNRGPISESSSPFLAASLVPAMRIGKPLSVEGKVSPKLLASVPTVERVLSGWYGHLTPIQVNAEPAPEHKAVGVACFFSGGVDSFYSVLRHLDEVTGLVFVHGFDIQPRDVLLRACVSESLRKAAARLGKPLIEVETNVRAFSDQFTLWSEEYHGSALASVALLLSPQFGRFYIPASFSPHYSPPWGSHKDLDPLWSTDATDIIHDGWDASRVEKVRLVASSDVAMQSLRVCWENRGGRYNCGRCEKCIRTMVNLRIVGALGRCTTFDNRLDLRAVERVPIPDECARAFVEENLEAARESGQDELARAIARSLGRRQGGLVDRVRKGDLRRRLGRRIQRSLGRPTVSWELSDMPVAARS
jgi:hypothetical protein